MSWTSLSPLLLVLIVFAALARKFWRQRQRVPVRVANKHDRVR